MKFLGITPLLAAALLCSATAPATAANNALHFDGSGDRVQMPVPAVLANSATQDFSVSTWLRRENDQAAQRVFFAQQSSTNAVTMLVSGANLLLYVRRGDGTTMSASTLLPPADTWSHVTATWTAATSTIAIYLDGEVTASSFSGNTSMGTDGLMTLGARTDGQQGLRGALDEFRIWRTVLTPAQVRVLARSTCSVDAPLAAAYDFDVGTPGGNNAGLVGLPEITGAGAQGTLIDLALDGPTSNWIASGVQRATPALVFDPPLPELLLTGEDGNGYTGTVRLAAPPLTDVTIAFAVSDTSEAEVSTPSLTFSPTDWDQPRPIAVSGVDDALVDGIVDYDLLIDVQTTDTCFSALGATHPARNIDDESASVVATPAQQLEGDASGSTMLFDLALSAAVPGGLTVAFDTADGTALAGSDYTATSGTAQFTGTAGEVQQVAVPLLGNRIAQADRTLLLRLGPASLPHVPVLPAQVQGTILDDDPATIVAVGTTQPEGDAGSDSVFVFELALDTAVDGPVSVPFHTVDGTAVAGVDYVASSGTVQFAGAAGEVQRVEITVPGNDLVQTDRRFTLQLGAASSPRVGVAPSSVQGVIVDDDIATVSAQGAVLAEGDAGLGAMLFVLTLDADVPGGVAVPYDTADGTALAGTDYASASGTLQFAGIAGETQQVAVTVFDDAVAQGDRSFTLRLGPASNPSVRLAQASVQGVIVDDDIDVGITLANGVDTVSPGQPLSYALVVTNHSPTLAAAPVDVAFATSPTLDALRWTCTAFGGATCAAGGSGEFDQTVTLAPGSTAVFAIAGVVPQTHAGSVAASASATLRNGDDSQLADNIANDVDGGPVLFGDGFE